MRPTTFKLWHIGVHTGVGGRGGSPKIIYIYIYIVVLCVFVCAGWFLGGGSIVGL